MQEINTLYSFYRTSLFPSCIYYASLSQLAEEMRSKRIQSRFKSEERYQWLLEQKRLASARTHMSLWWREATPYSILKGDIMEKKTCENCANWRPKPDVKEPTGWICPKCGRSNSPFMTFCSHCSGWWLGDWWTINATGSPLTTGSSVTTGSPITTDKITINASDVSNHTWPRSSYWGVAKW